MSQERPLLMIVDGHALVHQGFHALPPTLAVRRTGEQVNAVYGFVSMLLKALEEHQPTHVAVAFDLGMPAFRLERYQDYKAQRPETPPELTAQFGRVREVLEAMHIPIYEVEGYEADDVIGTISQRVSEAGCDVLILTLDTDATQLVGSRVRVLASRRSFGDTVVYDVEAVKKRFGVAPQQIPDFKALRGDPSDNIPGVPGVGEKTAARLLREYHTVEGLYEHLEQVTPERLRRVLEENEEAARLGKELTTILRQVPLEFELEDTRRGDYDQRRLVELFQELEFRSLVDRLPRPAGDGAGARSRGAGVSRRYHVVNSDEGLLRLARRLTAAEVFSFDLETTSLDPMRAQIVGFAFSPAEGEAYYVPVGHRLGAAAMIAEEGSDLTYDVEDKERQLATAGVLEVLGPLLEDASRSKAAHNGNYDATVLACYGIEVQGLTSDTMIAAHLLGERALGLKALADRRLSMGLSPIESLIGSGRQQRSMADVDIPTVAAYACADADATLRLCRLLEGELREEGLYELYSEVEMPLVPVLVSMQHSGIALDTDLLRELSQELGRRLLELEQDIYGSVGHSFNIGSPRQLGQVLFQELGLPKSRRTKTGYSTDAAVLENLRDAHPVVRMVLQYRELGKLKSTYLDALPALINPATGRVHTSFNQTATATGRLSSSEPNLQNVPVRTDTGRQVREAFVARPLRGEEGMEYVLLAADYSQIELRILAHLSEDPALLAAFAADEDIHAATAAEVFGVPPDQVTPDMRRVAKVVNFGVIYGMGDVGVAQGTGITREEAADFIARYFARYAAVNGYLERTREEARTRGYVQTILGRRRYMPEINSPNAGVRAATERMAINMPIQGTAADIIKVAMVRLHSGLRQRRLKSRMLLQVHDELVLEVPATELEEVRSLVREVMSGAMKLRVPLKVELKTGANWGQLS